MKRKPKPKTQTVLRRLLNQPPKQLRPPTKKGWIKFNTYESFPNQGVFRVVHEWKFGEWPLFIYEAGEIHESPF
jgi:hypothetical protein